MEDLRIGIDVRAAAEVPAGRGRVVRELLRTLAGLDYRHRYILYAREAWAQAELDERFQWRLLDAKDPWWHWRAARAANGECDVFLSSNSYLTSRFLRIPSVAIVYDLATFERSLRPQRRARTIERLTLGMAVKRSAKLLAISQATAEALINRFPGAASRTVVAPLGVAPGLAGAGNGSAGLDADGASAGHGLDAAQTAMLPASGFVLAVGTLEPRKNLPRLVEAYAGMPRELQHKHPLVVVGALGWETNGTLGSLQSLGERCTMLGYVSDAALAELYRRCAVFCYPSLGEGFGLPVLEAMAAGAAVLTSNVSSLPEVGGEAVAYADPTEALAIGEQLQRLLRDESLRAELSTRARERAQEFSWEAFAETVLAVLEESAGVPARIADPALSA
ncbi:MAG TPA: glycosyltransferase family 1 protein [Solirubrobacteraceae bacterium]|nr:glycosyltransferase family 1 protein [Solirubrobacteraceae bacterium]